MVEEGVDLAVRVGELADSSMIVRKIATTPVVTVATPAYFATHGVPSSPSELEQHSRVVFILRGEPRPWEFRGKSGPIVHRPNGSFRTADAEQIRAAVLANLGLTHAPGYLFAPEIASGAVRAVLRDYEPAAIAISAVHPAGRRLPTKVRVFIDFLADAFAQDPNLALR